MTGAPRTSVSESQDETNFLVNNGVRIAWDVQGVGTPLLLVMGHTWSRHLWSSEVVSALSTHFRIVRFDNRGAGQSDAPRGPYSIAQMADDALAVLDAARVKDAHVYGASMGGLIAQEIALSNPLRVRSLILGCTWAPSNEQTFTRNQARLKYALPTPRWIAHAMAPARLYGPARDEKRVERDFELLASEHPTLRGLRGQAHAIAAYRSLDRLENIACPTLVLHGDHDRVIPLSWGTTMADHLPDSKLEVLPGAGHLYDRDAFEQSTQAVLNFLAVQA